MTRFVLVAGAWHGGWVWQRLRPILEAAGHRVAAPTLAGLGERAALATPEIGLEAHVQDLVDVLLADDLADTYLVAHSYAGIPATVASDRVPERLRGIIYLDAQVPAHGQRGFDVWPGAEALYRETSRKWGHGWFIPPPDDTFGIRSPDDLAWLRRQLTPHPLKTFEDRVLLRHSRAPVAAGAIICVNDEATTQIATQGLPTIEIASGHDAMVTDPDLLANALNIMVHRLGEEAEAEPQSSR